MPHTENQPEPPGSTALALRACAGASVLLASWYAMMAVHEVGHVVAAFLTGGSVERVVLPWVGFSRTDVSPNPWPLIECWAGPIGGVVLPAFAWGLARFIYKPAEPLLRFFAGWCLICNGAYLGLGWIDRVGDAGDLLHHGSAIWQLIAFGAISFACGLWLWHGLGRGLGLSDATKTSCRKLIAVALGTVLFYGVGSIALG